MRPAFITAIECDSANASLWSCVTYTVVILRSRCSRFSSKRMRSRSFASRLESGSSRSSRRGSMTSARASARRCCWPPESLVASRPAISSRATTLSTRDTRSWISCLENLFLETRSGKAAFSNTVMCGQMAYDWNTMPRPRRFGATKTPRCEEYTISPPTEISPCRGLSRPAMERSVVVLLQPLGPRSVNSFPCGTSKATSCAARIAWPRSSTYSVHNPVTLSTSRVLDAELPAHPLGEQHEHEQAQDEHHAERRQLDVLAVLPQLPDHDRQDLGPRAVEQDRARQLADGNDHDVDPAGDQPGLEQRQDDAAEGRRPARSAHRGGFLQLLVDLQHRGGVVAQAVGHEAGDVGDEHDPDRAVNTDRQVKVQDHDRQPEDDARKYHRQGSDVVEQPSPGQFRLDDDPADHRGHQHDQRGARHREEQAVPHRASEVWIAEDGAVRIEGQALQGLHRGHRIELLQRRPDEDRERQHYDQQGIDEEDGGGDIAPAAEIDRSRAKALSGHGGVLAAAARQPGLEIHADRREDEQGYGVGGCESDLAGVAVHRLVDGRREDLDAHRQAKQGRDFEGLDRAHEQAQQRGKTAGHASGSVMRDATCSTPAPLITADSSSAGSMARNAAV